MPILLSRQLSITSLASIVEKCQRQPMQSPLEYDLQLKPDQLDLILLSKPPKLKPPVPPKPNKEIAKSPVLTKLSNTADEGFESDIDTISLISCENESFSIDKSKPVLAETDSANGGSGTESETETEKTNTLTQKNVNSIRESLEKHGSQIKEKESFDLVDCVCYSDVTYPDVLIFVIKNEALVFKFDNLEKLQAFYTNFTTLKAVTNQKAYNLQNLHKNLTAPKYNLLQRTDHNGVTHIEIKKQKSSSVEKEEEQGVTKIRQRTESKLINELLSDSKFTSKQDSNGGRPRIVRSNSIENILNLETKDSDLVSERNTVGSLRKVWNSAEDLLDSGIPRRPERRRKKKPAPLPPPQIATIPDKIEDVFSGQFVRVNVNTERLKDYSDKNRLVVKSTNEPHPKKLGQNFNLLSRNNFTSLLKPSTKTEQTRRPPPESSATLNRPQRFEKNTTTSSWTNSVPRLLKKTSRSKSETRTGQNFQPMAYRYIDTTSDYSYNTSNQNNAMFLNAMMRPKTETLTTQPRISFGYNVPGFTRHQENTMGNRVFGLTPKIKDFSRSEGGQGGKWASASDLTFLDREGGNLKSSIKHGEGGKKKNEKKVTFSAYTTVQVV